MKLNLALTASSASVGPCLRDPPSRGSRAAPSPPLDRPGVSLDCRDPLAAVDRFRTPLTGGVLGAPTRSYGSPEETRAMHTTTRWILLFCQ